MDTSVEWEVAYEESQTTNGQDREVQFAEKFPLFSRLQVCICIPDKGSKL